MLTGHSSAGEAVETPMLTGHSSAGEGCTDINAYQKILQVSSFLRKELLLDGFLVVSFIVDMARCSNT